MLFSIGLIFLLGLIFGWLFRKINLPSLLGMIIVGIIIGPYALNLIDGSLLSISADIRKIALIIILTRGGLSLSIADLKKIGRPALLMSFVPATLEIIGMVILAPIFLHVSIVEALLIGSIVAAVSPAVIVPKMINLIEKGYGKEKGIPQLVLAGASLDDIYVIVLFYAFIEILQGEALSVWSFVNIPLSIILGAGIGYLIGYLLIKYFKRFEIQNTYKVFIVLSITLILVAIEDHLNTSITFSALVATFFLGMSLTRYDEKIASELSARYNQLWTAGEIFLFVLVGATVNLAYVTSSFVPALLLIICVLAFRIFGVFLSILGTNFTLKEKVFCMIAYTPKATVQAAIGAIPLSLGLEVGDIALTVAIIAILFTAPVGAFLIDLTYEKFLDKN